MTAGPSAFIRRGVVLAAFLTGVLPRAGAPQIAPLPLGSSVAETMALIHAEGAAHPRSAVSPPYPDHHLKGWIENQDRFGPPPEQVGDATRRCVAVPAGGVMRHWDRTWVPTAYMRTGDFRVSAGRALVHGEGQKLPWTPAVPSPGMELTLRARNLARPGEAFEMKLTDVLSTDQEEGDEWRPWAASFPTGIVFPADGTWVVVGTSGSNWGCLVYSVS